MEVITIEKEAYKRLLRKIDRIDKFVTEIGTVKSELFRQNEKPPVPEWINNDEASQMFHVSKRTLQRLRSNSRVSFTIRAGKCCYRPKDVAEALNYSYHPAKSQYGTNDSDSEG